MNKTLRKNKLVGVGLIAGIGCLVANPAQAADFHFTYEFGLGAISPNTATIFEGKVSGDVNGNSLDNAVISVFNVIQPEFDAVNPIASFVGSDFTGTIFTFDGTGLLIQGSNAQGTVNLQDSIASYVTATNGQSVFDVPLEPSRWELVSVDDKPDVSVPEGNMSVVSWLALAGIGGLSVKYGKRKSL